MAISYQQLNNVISKHTHTHMLTYVHKRWKKTWQQQNYNKNRSCVMCVCLYIIFYFIVCCRCRCCRAACFIPHLSIRKWKRKTIKLSVRKWSRERLWYIIYHWLLPFVIYYCTIMKRSFWVKISVFFLSCAFTKVLRKKIM